jgi:integrase
VTRGEGRKTRTPGTFGSVDKRATGYRARYTGPDGRRHQAPTLFIAKRDARAWLSLRHAEIVRGQWMPPEADDRPAPRLTLADYAELWFEQRDLRDRTRAHYRKILDAHIKPAPLGPLPLASITADDVRAWYAATLKGRPTYRSHAYGLLRTIMGTAASDGKITANPCVIRGAGNAKRVHKIRPATLDELAKLVDAMPEPYRVMVLLASWCALRFGELTELRRRDIDIDDGVIRVRRGVVRIKGEFVVGPPKSDAGTRDVAIPPHLLPAVRDHLVNHVEPGQDSLLFPAINGGHLAEATLTRWYYKAREAASRPDLRFHDLRHSGAVLAAATGATLAELMGRLGHSSPAAALRYQHAAQGADKRIAAALSALVEPTLLDNRAEDSVK